MLGTSIVDVARATLNVWKIVRLARARWPSGILHDGPIGLSPGVRCSGNRCGRHHVGCMEIGATKVRTAICNIILHVSRLQGSNVWTNDVACATSVAWKKARSQV